MRFECGSKGSMQGSREVFFFFFLGWFSATEARRRKKNDFFSSGTEIERREPAFLIFFSSQHCLELRALHAAAAAHVFLFFPIRSRTKRDALRLCCYWDNPKPEHVLMLLLSLGRAPEGRVFGIRFKCRPHIQARWTRPMTNPARF